MLDCAHNVVISRREYNLSSLFVNQAIVTYSCVRVFSFVQSHSLRMILQMVNCCVVTGDVKVSKLCCKCTSVKEKVLLTCEYVHIMYVRRGLAPTPVKW